MTLDDARARLTAALDDPTAARWLTPDYIAAIRLVLDALPTREPVEHGRNCQKMTHLGNGYLHDADDDRPYDVDGVTYCGRCHRALGRDTETPR